MNDLLHFSAEPLAAVNDCEPCSVHPFHKPNGLWLSVGEAWPEWCLGEDYGLRTLKYVTCVMLRLDAKVLWLRDMPSLLAFDAEYRVRSPREAWRERDLDWPRVHAEFDGIIIDPYQRDARHTLGWYYSWDVASGCIWRACVVETLSDSIPFTRIAEAA